MLSPFNLMVPSFILETHAAAPSSLKDFPVWEKPGYQVNNSVIKTKHAKPVRNRMNCSASPPSTLLERTYWWISWKIDRFGGKTHVCKHWCIEQEWMLEQKKRVTKPQAIFDSWGPTAGISCPGSFFQLLRCWSLVLAAPWIWREMPWQDLSCDQRKRMKTEYSFQMQMQHIAAFSHFHPFSSFDVHLCFHQVLCGQERWPNDTIQAGTPWSGRFWVETSERGSAVSHGGHWNHWKPTTKNYQTTIAWRWTARHVRYAKASTLESDLETQIWRRALW